MAKRVETIEQNLTVVHSAVSKRDVRCTAGEYSLRGLSE